MGRRPEREVVGWLTRDELEELNEEIRSRKVCAKSYTKEQPFPMQQKKWE